MGRIGVLTGILVVPFVSYAANPVDAGILANTAVEQNLNARRNLQKAADRISEPYVILQKDSKVIRGGYNSTTLPLEAN